MTLKESCSIGGSVIPFPKVPEWDGTTTIQTISPVDNPDWNNLTVSEQVLDLVSGETTKVNQEFSEENNPQKNRKFGKTNNHLYRISRIHPKAQTPSENAQINETETPANTALKESHREVIWLAGSLHRGPYAMIDFYDAMNKKYDAIYSHFDNPKSSYDVDRLSDQVIDYMRQLITRDPEKEFVICAASVGEVTAREIYRKLNLDGNKDILPHIKHHFSVCGVSDYDNTSVMWGMVVNTIKSRIGRIILPWASNALIENTGPKPWTFKKLLGDTFFAEETAERADMLKNAWEKRHGKKKKFKELKDGTTQVRHHRDRGRLSLKTADAQGDMAKTTHGEQVGATPITTPLTTVLFSTDDGTFKNPEQNAKNDARFFNNTNIIKMEDAGHVDVVFQYEKYLDPIEAELNKIWREPQKQAA